MAHPSMPGPQPTVAPGEQAGAAIRLEAAGITVAVPVFGGGAIVERCLERLVRHTDPARAALLVVADGDRLFAASPLADRLVAAGVRVELLEARGGFAAAANRAFELAAGDVVLVNSDVLVAVGWLDQLAAAATSEPRVASVTPWSNDGSVAAFPRPFRSNPLPPGWSIDELAARITRTSPRLRPRLPTGVGSCLYLRREALDAVGGFDAATFGLGYGEETDWCFRASGAGFVHLLDDATYVFHRGQSSFGFARGQRVARAERLMRRRHPGYTERIAAAMANDPARASREQLVADLAGVEPALGAGPRSRGASRPRRVFHLVHGLPSINPAGTELYAERLAHHQARHREVMIHARAPGLGAPHGATIEQADPDRALLVRWISNDFRRRDPLARNAIRDRILARDVGASLDRFGPDLVHIHHLSGHGASALSEASRRRLPIVFQLQDWWSLCARANLLDHRRRLCPGPSAERCAACLPLTALPPSGLLNRILHRVRRRVLARALGRVDALVMGSTAIRDSYAALGALPPGVPVHVLDYGTPPVEVSVRPSAVLPLRAAVIGSLMPHKGVHVAVAAFAGIAESEATLELWGDPAADPAYADELRRLAGPAVRFRGRFAEGEREQVFAGIDLLLVPSLGLESYGLVVREALARGIPVLASDRGALPEAFVGAEAGGRVLPAGDVAALAATLAEAIAEPSRVDRWRLSIAPQSDVASHAAAVEEVYRAVLEARR